ncbi:MAG: 3-dehydroquinate synthase II [Promethearchaeota archaeon]|nr:MAG: 3-dehydroquinate synthase II [Candidatus Lokiarchaeota archaeon]
MKKILLNFKSRGDDFNELVQEAFNRDILHFLVSKDTYSEFENIERVKTYSWNKNLDTDYLIFNDMSLLEEQFEQKDLNKSLGYYKELKSKDDEDEIRELANTNKVDFIIVSAKDWKIIPFENLIASMHKKDTELIADVENIEEAELMLKTLEIGVDGVLYTPQKSMDLIDLKNLVGKIYELELTEAEIKTIQSIPESDRVCVDTTSLLRPGEGMLIGSTAMGFALVHAEVFETQFVASRPFRVNAGDVSAYILVPEDDPNSLNIYRTKYLSEIKGGVKVLAVNKEGKARIVSVGRVKIETRPMLRFELEAKTNGDTIPISCICQNAETIRLVDTQGEAVSVVNLKEGDKVLVHLGPGATHFGTAIEETIIEK